MAQCKQSSQEFIKNAFTPQIAVITTELVEKCCQKNNLSFVELLQPFSKLNSDVHYKDPSGQTVQIRGLKLTFLDVDSRPPQTTLARKYLNSSVSESSDFKTESYTIGDYQLEITLTSPWFEAWRDTFLKVQYPSDHEYTKHFLACVIVISSNETNPLDKINELLQNLNQVQNNALEKLPKWFNSNILKYYAILHDNIEGNNDITNESYKVLKQTYGESNCFLLKINSKPLINSINNEHLPDPWSQFISNNFDSKDFIQTPDSSPLTIRAVLNRSQEISNGKIDANYHPLSPDTEELILNNSTNQKDVQIIGIRSNLHGHYLTTDDLEQIKLFIYEFCKSCLLPYIEKQMQLLNDVVSNKKGVSRSLFSATKRWFNPNKPGASSVAVNNLIYAPDSPELQVRRLADLYFMFGNYKLAFQAYHLAKRDYNGDQAWLYYAGALEMASLSAFMADESDRKTYDYMEESITTYLNTCKMPQFATRATLLSSECLKNRGLYGEAAHQLIRMTSEESDLRSALFLEQAAYCFLHSKMVRKYAFHMVLAGHRYSKAAQRKHSLRSYKQAHQIYERSGWDLAEDHIHYTIGRQAHNLHCFNEAVESFARLLNGDSKQSAQQQNIFLKEYLTILENKLKKDNDKSIPTLVLPELDINGLKLLMGPTPPLMTPGKIPAVGVRFTDSEDNDTLKKWYKLEEMLVQEAQTTIPPLFQPMITLYNINNLNKNQPVAIVNEPIQVCIHLINSLQILLHLKDIYLLCNFDNNNGDVVSNELPNNSNNIEQYIKTHVTKSTLIQANSSDDLILSLTPLATGLITLKGICYTLISSTTPSDIFITGKQLFNVEKIAKKLLEINVVPLAPCLQVTFSEINSEFLCDEVQRINIDFVNTGPLPLCKVLMATSVPQLLCNCEAKTEPRRFDNFANLPLNLKEKLIRENHVTSIILPNDQLQPGQTTTMSIYIKAPNKPGPCLIDLLVYYESVNPNIKPRYRVVRHKWNLTVQESINVEISSQRSYNSKKVEELALVLKTTNLNKIHNSTLTEISLLNIGMLSKYWRLTEDIVTPKYINLSSQESAHILLKAKRIINDDSTYSNILLNTERNIRQNINMAYLKFAKKTEYCQINMFDDEYLSNNNNNENLSNNNNNNDNSDRVMKDEINNGIVFIQWQALVNDINNRRIVNGQTQLTIDINKIDDTQQIDEFTLQDPANLLEVSINRERNQHLSSDNKITYNLIYPGIVEHNFNKEKSCIIPITLLLHSIVNDSVNVTINTLKTRSLEQVSRSSLLYPYASKNFTWLGIGSAVKQLKPLSSDTIKLNVIITGPGTFDLNSKIEILCNTNLEQTPILQNCQTPSTLIVLDGKI